jgi:hypothetical protein
MIDLETLGTVPGCAILSIGAVAFDEFGVAEEGFYAVVNIPRWDCAGLTGDGLIKDKATIAWWKSQSEEARAVLTAPGGTLRQALDKFKHWLANYDSPRVWGNGADFDNPILAVAARKAGLGPDDLWRGYNGRCYRTVKSQFKDIKLVRSGTHHNALDDARSQAEHLVQICRQRDWKLA